MDPSVSTSVRGPALTPSEETLLVEYAATNDVYLQYDGYRWQAGSFLIAGVFVYWGFLMQSDVSTSAFGMSSLLITALMSCWLCFAMHYRQLYIQKLARLHEIEAILGMKQHLRFVTKDPGEASYRSEGVGGHAIDQIVYGLTALGGSALFAASREWSWWCLVPVPLVAFTLWYVNRNERRLQRRRKSGYVT